MNSFLIRNGRFSIGFLVALFALTAYWIIAPSRVPSASAQTSSFSSRWNSWFRSAPPPRPGTGRGDGFCPVGLSPGQVNLIGNDRPTLTWLGNVEKIELRAANETTPLWNYSPHSAEPVSESAFDRVDTLNSRPLFSVALPTLQPDITYELRIYDQPDVEPINLNLRRLSAVEQTQIQQDLQQINPSAPTTEAASLSQAEYFARKNLWSSFWQTLLAVESPSTALTELMQTTLTEICPSEPR